MLQIRSTALKLHSSKFSTCAILCGRDKFRQEQKRLKEKQIKIIQKSNPYNANVGMRHQLMNTELPDPEDPVFQEVDYGVDITERLESIASQSKIDQRKFEERLPKHVKLDKDEIRRSIVKKKYFPDPPEQPVLVTWLEQQLMKKLHESDPVNWSFEALSECFPVTPRSAKKLVKNKMKWYPDQIKARDEKVKQNWKLLMKGQLDNSEKILEHLEKVGQNVFSDGIDKYISNGQKQNYLQEITADYQRQFQTPKANLSGEFGKLLVTHHKRMGKYKDDEFEVKNMLPKHSDFFASLNLPSEYSDTTLVNAETNNKLDQEFMTIGKFRQRFYKEMKKKAQIDENAKKYFQWMKIEKPLMEKLENPVEKLEDVELDQVIDERTVKKYIEQTVVLTSQSGKALEIRDKIDIPSDLYKEHATYQLGQNFYDSNGDFLYRIPINN